MAKTTKEDLQRTIQQMMDKYFSPKEISIPPDVRATLEPGARAFRFLECTVIVGHSENGWHMSISHPERYPTWDEIRDARYLLVPDDVTMAMILPPRDEYINVHNTCFHLWEIKEMVKFLKAEDEAFRKAGVKTGRVEFTCPICGGLAIGNRYEHGGKIHGMGSGCTKCGVRHT